MVLKINDVTVLKMYDSNQSTHEIAQHFGTYTNKIRRILIKHGRKIRGHSEAQALAITSGRAQHPTEGKARSEEVKIKISEGVHEHWEQMDDAEYQSRSDSSKEHWNSLTEAEKEHIQSLASKGMRKAAKEGSKIEKFVRKYLTDRGFVVIFHQKNLVPNTKLEIDLFIPELKTAIEIDGPSHFLPIWGEENLKRHIRSDSEKSGLLISHGYCMIRVKNTERNISNIQMRTVAEQILNKLIEIKRKFPPKTQRYYQLEVQ